MLTHLKNALNKKKLYIVLKHSKSNMKLLNDLMYLNIFSGYNLYIKKKKTFLLTFINYDTNLNFTIAELSTTELNYYTLKEKYFNTNFIISVKNLKSGKRVTCIKFR